MCPDDLAWEQAEETSDKWLAQFLEVDLLRPIAEFILSHNRGNAGAVLFPEEKVANEVAVMRFLVGQTSIPIPFILHCGTKKESPLELSPFIIMDYIEHKTKMYDALNIPGCGRLGVHIRSAR